LPKGWFNYDGWAMNDGGTLIVAFWDVNKVYPTGCHWASKPMIDPGPTVDGLARVLHTRPLRHASKPKGVTLGGFHGKYLRWSVPRNMSWAHCRQGYFESWTAKGWASDRYQQGGGQVDRLWILNVDGQRLVIDAAYLDATKKQRAELNRIVHSIQFLPESTQTPAQAASSADSGPFGATGINNRGPVIGTVTSRAIGTLRGYANYPSVWKKGSRHRQGRRDQQAFATSATSAQAAANRNGSWIAYSTAPASDAFPGYREWGSDVFVTRVGGRPELVAGRGKAKVWNVCPAFSPNGRMLAFARVTNTVVWSGRDRSTIVVVRLGPRGPIRAGRLVLKVRGDRARCPVWSSDGSRLAYLEYGRVVVRDLQGSRRHRSGGDPTIRDFDRRVDELVSPLGDLVARRGPDGTIVSRLDGSDQRVIKDGWTAGWSPDGRKLVFVDEDGGVGLRMQAVSVDPPFASETVIDHGPINGARAPLPGYGDVSWQPIPDHRRVVAATTATEDGCAQFAALKGALPQARAIGFRGRTGVRATPLWPGSCGTWSTSYRRGGRAAVEVSLTSFSSTEQADGWLETTRGWERLANGGFVTFGAAYDVESVYRNVIIFSRSIPDRPGWLDSQIHLHRQIRTRVCALANLGPPLWCF
jgi:hypothetical protein